MNVREFGTVVLLAAIWGVSFLLIHIAAPVLGPMVLVTVRMLVAGSVLWLYARVTRQPRPAWQASWHILLTLGLLNSALPLMLEAFAVVHLNASLTAVLSTTTPLVTALLGAIWLRERVTFAKATGLVTGLLGVGLLVGWSPLPVTWTTGIAVGAALLASTFYAVAALYAKAAVRHILPLPLAIGQELAAGGLLLPLTLVALPAVQLTAPVLAATVTLALVMTAGGNLLYFHLIARVGATRTQTVSFLVPVFALLTGVLILGEPFTTSMAIGLGVILVSVVLVVEVPLPVRVWAAVQERVGRRVRGAATTTLLHRGSVYRPWRWRMKLRHPSYAMVAVSVLYDRHSVPALA